MLNANDIEYGYYRNILIPNFTILNMYQLEGIVLYVSIADL